MSLHIYTDSPEPMLLAKEITTKITFLGYDVGVPRSLRTRHIHNYQNPVHCPISMIWLVHEVMVLWHMHKVTL